MDLPDYKPVSVSLRMAVIPLGPAFLPGSSDLPESLAERAAPPLLFGLAPRGVFPAGADCSGRGALLPHLFTLTPGAVRHGKRGRCGGADDRNLSSANSQATNDDGLRHQNNSLSAPHYPGRRYLFCGTIRETRFERASPAVSRHAALRRPDFPPPGIRERLPVRQAPEALSHVV